MVSEVLDLRYLLALLHLPGMGPVKLKELINTIPKLSEAFAKDGRCLVFEGQADWKAVDRDIEWSLQESNHILSINDLRYPRLLKEIHSAPPVIFVRGAINVLSKAQIAIVGSRHPTQGGRESAQRFSRIFASKGLVITSGLATGIDGIAHTNAIDEGKTIAVLANGLDHVYPAAHRSLAEQIVEQGALVSEFPLGVPPVPSHFPRRNRIISGLSIGTLVVEAALKSGSLITANYALEQGREVFAIPGSIHSSQSRGCHALIRQGAKLVETPEDVLEELGSMLQFVSYPNYFSPKKEVVSSSLPPHQELLLGQVGYDVTPIDSLVARLGLTVGEVSSMLLELEMQGMVRVVHGGVARVLV